MSNYLLDAIAFTSFEQCQPLNRRFDNISRSPGIYAIRHKTEGLLYIGKAQNLRSRFSGGHKAFLWAWLDKYRDEDVRIAVQAISHWEKLLQKETQNSSELKPMTMKEFQKRIDQSTED